MRFTNRPIPTTSMIVVSFVLAVGIAVVGATLVGSQVEMHGCRRRSARVECRASWAYSRASAARHPRRRDAHDRLGSLVA